MTNNTMNKKAGSISDALRWTVPWETGLDDNPTAGKMWKNILGVSAAAIPATLLATWLANEYNMRKTREEIDKNTIANLNANSPVLSPNQRGSSSDDKNREANELGDIYKSMVKKASASWLERTVYGAAPMLALPVATWITASAVNSMLKDKYAKELDDENKELQDLQDRLDAEELERLGYIKKNKSTVPINKKASVLDAGGALVDGVYNGLGNIWGIARKGAIDLPSQLILLATLAAGGYGVHHFLKEHKDSKTLKLLSKKMYGKDRLLSSPELAIELPKGYEETGRTTAQILPGITPAKTVGQPIEDAVIVEKDKKDAFLG